MANNSLINWNVYRAEEDAIEQLDDPVEAEVRQQLLDEIYDKALDYQSHINQYQYTQHCKAIEARGLRFSPISKKTVTKKWDRFFASELSTETKKSIYFRDFKWHMFSYGKVQAKEGSAAKQAFNRLKKGAAYIFIQCTDEAWYIENAQLLTAADLGVNYDFGRSDVYIFDADGKWTYVRTHESYCGPYFLRKK